MRKAPHRARRPRAAAGRRPAGHQRNARRRGDSGFTIVESVVALSLLLVVMVGMIATVNTGVKGVRIGRQRAAGIALAAGTLESTRAVAYDLLGHDYAGDPTLATDAALVPAADHTTFETEELAGASGGVAVLNPHQRPVSEDGTDFDRRVYVTWPAGGVQGGAAKRVTVVVTWDTGLGGATGRMAEIRLSTVVDATGQTAPLAGTATLDASLPSLTVTGLVEGHAVDARLVLPAVTGRLDHGVAPMAAAVVANTTAEIAMTGVSVAGCAVATGFTSCGPQPRSAVADASADTVPGHQAALAPAFDPGGSGSAGSTGYQLDGGGSTQAGSFVAAGAGQGDADGRPYQSAGATSASLVQLLLRPLGLNSQLLRTAGAGAVSGTLDVDPAASSTWVTATGSLSGPAVAVADFDGSILGATGYDGALRVSASTLAASATVGAGAPPASLTASPVTVELYNGSFGSGGYLCYRVAPATGAVTDCGGAPATIAPTSTAFAVAGGYVAQVTTSTTVTAAATTGAVAGGSRVASSASSVGWLQVDVHLTLFKSTQVVSLDLHYDAGRLAVAATGTPRT